MCERESVTVLLKSLNMTHTLNSLKQLGIKSSLGPRKLSFHCEAAIHDTSYSFTGHGNKVRGASVQLSASLLLRPAAAVQARSESAVLTRSCDSDSTQVCWVFHDASAAAAASIIKVSPYNKACAHCQAALVMHRRHVIVSHKNTSNATS